MQDFRQRRFLGEDSRDRRCAQRTPHQLVGDDIDILLLIAVGIDAAVPTGDARERPIGDQRGEFDRSRRDGLDHRADRSAVRRLQGRPIKM